MQGRNEEAAFSRAKRGVLFGVSIPSALLAMTPLKGVLSGPFWWRWRAGVPAADGVPARKRGTPTGGASGIDCSALVPSPICTSSISEEGKSMAGGDDMRSEAAAMLSDERRSWTRRDASILGLGQEV